MAGALSQLTLGSSSQCPAVEEHLRRQGWEAGNIDYMGADAFDNIWAKIAQTLSGPTAEGPAPEVAPVVAQEPAPIVAEKPVPVVAAEPTPAPAAPVSKAAPVEELIDEPKESKETPAPPSSIESSTASTASTLSSASSAYSASSASSAASVVSTDKDPQGLYAFINLWLVVAMFVSLK